MIEITHKQAKRMIREEQDRRLPDDQWAMLQAHLESCADCRGYQARLGSVDHNLSRSLRSRWGGVHGPQKGIDKKVLKIIENRRRFRKGITRALPWVLGALLLIGFIAYREVTAPEPIQMPTPTKLFGIIANQTPTPPPPKIDFRGLTVFESRRDGNSEIYLLSITPQGPELTNLTQNPAQDTRPSWSPDGEWLAFLSDRTGKNEVYIMHISGSRLAQLTSDPNIDWQGPLAWSYDGQYIGVSGRRGAPNEVSTRSNASPATQDWLYLVPTKGGQPLSLAASYGAEPWIRFSNSQPAFAYAGGRGQMALNVANTLNGWSGNVTLEDSQTLDLQPLMNGAFDWTLGGRSLIYVVSNPSNTGDNVTPLAKTPLSQVRFSQDIEAIDHQNFTGTGSETIDTVEAPNRFRAVSWMPNSLVIASLVGNDAENCWSIRLVNAYNHSETPRSLTGLCVVGGLSGANWSTDGNWLVLLARKLGETKASLYALRLPDLVTREDTLRGYSLSSDNQAIQKLWDLSSEPDAPVQKAAPSSLPDWAEPRVRPSGRLLNIAPSTAAVAAAAPSAQAVGIPVLPTAVPTPTVPAVAPAFPPADTPGWLVYSVTDGANSQMIRVRPDGTQRMKLTGSPAQHDCPRLSPDGKTIAYIGSQEDWRSGINEVFRMDVDGKNVTQLTQTSLPAAQAGRSDPFPRYDCPVWSPDGKQLAAVMRLQYANFLTIISVDGKTPPQYLRTESVSALSAPVWVPKNAANPALGSSQILLVYPQGVKPARLVAVDLTGLVSAQPTPAATPVPATETPLTLPNQPVRVVEILPLIGWDDVQNLTLSPDGKYLAGIFEYLNNINNTNRLGRSIAQLRVMDAGSLDLAGAVILEDFDSQNAGLGGLYWLPDGWLGVMRVARLIGPGKTVFQRFDPANNRFETTASFEDVGYRVVFNQGRWVFFSAESGLWTLDMQQAGEGRPSPGLVSSEPVINLDWK